MRKLILSAAGILISVLGFAQQMDLPVTFDVAGVDYGVIGFEGAEASTIEADPTEPTNTVVKVIKSAAAQPWAGTTITNPAGEGLATPIPFSATNTQMSLRVWSPDAGIQVRLKVEDSNDPTRSVETEAAVTTAAGWETLTFNFANQANGTAQLNLAYSYNKASVFFNFGTNGATAGEKTYYFDDLQFVQGGGATSYNVTFSVDMNNVPPGFTTPEVNGTFNNWCGGCAPMADSDNDGVWTLTASIPVGTHEFKFAYDSWAGSEDLTPGTPCVVTNNGFTNRSLIVSNANVVLPTVCWASCVACNVVVLDQMDLPVTFEEDNIEYGVIGFEGAQASTIEVDPTDATNTVVKVIKSAAAQPWAGTTITAPAELGLATPIPFTAPNTTMTLRVWSPDAGIPVRLKVEDHSDPTITVETEATVTTAAGWETLTFDFANEANGTAAINFANTYDKASVFFNFGTNGATAGEKTYYFDDLAMGESSVEPDTFSVTFLVDMNQVTQNFTTPEVNGTFNNWCGGCAPMSDANADGVWELTIELPAGTYEYKFAADSWAISEQLADGQNCVVNNGGFVNRALVVSGDATLPLVCWASCSACPSDTSAPYAVLFRVDMSNVTEAYTTPEVNGTFNNWCGGCAPMADPDDDGVWELVIELPAGTFEYKFAADSWGIQEELAPGGSCVLTTGQFTNRVITVNGDVNLPEVCWASCSACDNPTGPFNVTFKVDMRDVTAAYTTPEVNGTFNNWCGGCAPMADPDGDDIWELVVSLPADTFEFKFAADSWAIQENLTSGSSCTVTTDNFTNRQLIVTGESVLQAVCWGSCDPCIVGINDLSAQEELVLFPNPANEALTLNLREAATSNVLVTITDATGRTIQSEVFAPAKQFTITTNTLAGGLYFVRINAGNTILTRPFMVNN